MTARDRSYALCRKGLIKSVQNAFSEAKSLLAESIHLGGLPDEITPSCSYALVQLYVVEKEPRKALDLLKSMGEPRLAKVYLARLWALGAEAARAAGDTPQEIIFLQRALQMMESEGFSSVQLKILGDRVVTLEEVKSRLGLDPRSKAQTKAPPWGNPPPVSADRFGKLVSFMYQTLEETKRGNWAAAEARWALIEKRNLGRVIERVSGFKPPSKQIEKRLASMRKRDPRKLHVGFLLPSDPALSGLSFRLLRAASAFMASPGASGAMMDFSVQSAPTDPGAVEAAALKLILEDGVHVIIGPISSALTIGALSPAHTFGVPLYALGPVSDQVSKLSPMVVRMGVLARSQTDLLARHAKEIGLETIGLLSPNDAYGFEMSRRMGEAVQTHGLKVDRATFYDAFSDVYKDAVEEALGPQDEESRKDEYEAAISAAKAKAREEKRKFDPKEVELPPLIRFDALFIPDSLRRSRVIASTFAFLDAKSLRLFGDRQWNDSTFRRSIADEFINGSRIPTPSTGRYLSHLLLNLGADTSAKAKALGTLDLERQVFDALLLVRQGHYFAGGLSGHAMVDGLRSRPWKLEGTTKMSGLTTDGEPLTEFHLRSIANGQLTTNLPPWTGEGWQELLTQWARNPEASLEEIRAETSKTR